MYTTLSSAAEKHVKIFGWYIIIKNTLKNFGKLSVSVQVVGAASSDDGDDGDGDDGQVVTHCMNL